MTSIASPGRCAILLSVLIGTLEAQSQKPGLSNQPMLVLPFTSAVNASGVPVLRIQNLGTGENSWAFFGEGWLGMEGRSNAAKGGRGVVGSAAGEGSVGMYGLGEKGGIGVYGTSGSHDNDGVRGVGLRGVKGITWTDGGAGVVGVFRKDEKGSGSLNPSVPAGYDGLTRGWLGTEGNGVQGSSDVPGGFGVAGKADANENSVGVYGQSFNGLAGFFRGKVTITDHLMVKTIYVESITAGKGLIGGAAAKFFKIDHPLDPANKFLYHASIESDELKNLYDGVAILDDNGTAIVSLPAWFEALNKDFRYQLTCIGGSAPVYIAKEIQNGRFAIAGGRPGVKVSWQVTGVRQDAHARAHPMKVEEAKASVERGKYLSPVEHGRPVTAGINYSPDSIGSLDGKRRPQ